MPLYTLTFEKVQECQNQLEEKEQEVVKLE